MLIYNLYCEINANHTCMTEKQSLFGALCADFVLYSILYSFLSLFNI